MTYDEAIEFLYNSVPAYHMIGSGAYKPGLGNSLRLDDMFGNPHRAYPCIHIAGTNGKGSTAHTLAAILQSAGYRTGLYTSPHIFDFRERIRIDGVPVSEKEVVDFVEEWQAKAPADGSLQPSFFELTSTMAMTVFARRSVDVAVIETGLGGRLDSTNIITPVLSIITNISPDHTALLGSTPAEIASEKAGIIKPGVPVVIGEWTAETLGVFGRAAVACGSALHLTPLVKAVFTAEGNLYPATPFGSLKGELAGVHQALNASTVIQAVKVLRSRFAIPDVAVAEGFARVRELTGLFGRWTQIATAPRTVADTGHNCGGWEQIVATLATIERRRTALVVGFVADKDLDPIFRYISKIPGDVRLWFSQPSVARGLPCGELADRARSHGLDGTAERDVNKALAEARSWAGEDGFVLVAGSNFLIADLKLTVQTNQD